MAIVALSAETLSALVGFAVASTIGPGPNNIMLASSGASFGLKRTLPHIAGIVLGFSSMVFVITLGLGEVFRSQPALRQSLAWAGFAVMLWLAWRIGSSGGGKRAARARPLSLATAALFQWVNPKAWVLTIGTAATYARGEAPVPEALSIALVFAMVTVSTALIWGSGGAALGRILGTGIRLRIFNITMGVLLALSALLLVVSG
ncbi:LysE family translocator [Acuticoccus mangrovi]|uniref:LysE family translocator n=1 Tax=Acuticoccus mangrovi TaxID=2796142 RepID=A0A934ME85_9HYPH|nr:LysE family translocator [Acuticoccus mangrovi]MBJ3777222.1 LysE family translocator [Acuticoccus mangrovi]